MKVGDTYYCKKLNSIGVISLIAERGYGVIFTISDREGILSRWVDRRGLELIHDSR